MMTHSDIRIGFTHFLCMLSTTPGRFEVPEDGSCESVFSDSTSVFMPSTYWDTTSNPEHNSSGKKGYDFILSWALILPEENMYTTQQI